MESHLQMRKQGQEKLRLSGQRAAESELSLGHSSQAAPARPLRVWFPAPPAPLSACSVMGQVHCLTPEAYRPAEGRRLMITADYHRALWPGVSHVFTGSTV